MKGIVKRSYINDTTPLFPEGHPQLARGFLRVRWACFRNAAVVIDLKVASWDMHLPACKRLKDPAKLPYDGTPGQRHTYP